MVLLKAASDVNNRGLFPLQEEEINRRDYNVIVIISDNAQYKHLKCHLT